MSTDTEQLEEVVVDEPAVLIRINQTFKAEMTPDELYDATRRAWPLRLEHCQAAKYAFSLFDGIVQDVYEIQGWDPERTTPDISDIHLAPPDPKSGRLEFRGKPAPEQLRQKYRFKSLRHYFPKGAQFPVHYVNC